MKDEELNNLRIDLIDAKRLAEQYPCRTIENIVQNLDARINNELKRRKNE